MAARGKISIDRERCKGCHLCISACPGKNLDVDEELNRQGYRPARFRPDKDKKPCTGCSMCAVICPEVAIEVYREE